MLGKPKNYLIFLLLLLIRAAYKKGYPVVGILVGLGDVAVSAFVLDEEGGVACFALWIIE